jgi:hypothetical protein
MMPLLELSAKRGRGLIVPADHTSLPEKYRLYLLSASGRGGTG